MNPTTLFFIRHGEVYNPWNIVYFRLAGMRLSERGIAEIENTARFIAREKTAAIYSSPMLRARQTAQILQKQTRAPLHLAPNLNEVRSDFAGAPLAEMEALGWNFYDHSKNGRDETREQVVARLQNQLHLALEQHAGEQIVWVSHGDPIMLFTAWAKNFPLADIRQFKGADYIGHGSITKFIFNGDKVLRVEYFDQASMQNHAPALNTLFGKMCAE